MEMWKCHLQEKQLPIPDEDSLVFWEGCRRQRLLIQQCDLCKHFRFPPSPLCPHCLSSATTWQDDPGTGAVLTFCIYYTAIASPAWQAEVPYIVAVVALAFSGVKILSNLICVETALVRIGLPVKVEFDHITESITLPKFVPCMEATLGASRGDRAVLREAGG
jgi:uncharacterized OB-fold protein